MPQTFCWDLTSNRKNSKKAADQTLQLARNPAKEAFKSSTGGPAGAVLGVLAQYAVTGLLRGGSAEKMFAASALAALFFNTRQTDWLFTVNEHGQVTRFEKRSKHPARAGH